MEDSAITITLKPLILEAIKGSVEALTALVNHPLMLQLLKRISIRAALMYDENKDEIMQILWMKVRTRIRTLKKPDRIVAWLRAIAKNYCLNEKREKLRCLRRESANQEDEMSLAISTGLTPEEELIEKEEELLQQEYLKCLRKVTSRYPPVIVNGWLDEKTLKQIAEEAGMSIPKVWRIREKMFKEITRELRNKLRKK